jgi:hypothetical protein
MYGEYGVPGFAVANPGSAMIPQVPFEQPKNLFRYGEQSLWSTQLHNVNAALSNGTFRLFTTPLGQVGQGFATGLTIAETSLKEGGRIPAGVAFDAYGISCLVAGALTRSYLLLRESCDGQPTDAVWPYEIPADVTDTLPPAAP